MTDPIIILRRVSGGLLLAATAAALALAATGKEPRAILLAGMLWSLYGLSRAVLNGFLSPAMDWLGEALTGTTSILRDRGHSEIDALVAQAKYQDAAERWYREAVDGEAPAAAMLKRAELLAGPLTDPGTAAAELTQYRDLPRRPLSASEDVAIGLVLVELYERRLDDPARAMFELRRLLDRHPESRHVRRIRNTLVDLKERRFGDAHDTPETTR